MNAPQPGWYPDPIDDRRGRWWDGTIWTDWIDEHGNSRISPLPVPRRKRRVPVWLWVVLGLVVLPVLLALWPLLGVAAAVVAATGVVSLATRSRTWLRFRSRGAAVVVTSVATVVVLAVGGLTTVAVSAASSNVAMAEPAPFVQPVEGNRQTPSVEPSSVPTQAAEPSKAPSSAASPSATPEPTAVPSPTPEVRVVEVAVPSAIPVGRTLVDDANLPRGQSRIDVAGVDGEKVSVFRVTTVDGAETERVLIRESVSREAVSEITVVGTYDAPPPAAEPPSSEGCHASYADACVPIDSDVDCAGGKGNGPSYFDGVARVVGPDVYDLDRDGDGWACNG